MWQQWFALPGVAISARSVAVTHELSPLTVRIIRTMRYSEYVQKRTRIPWPELRRILRARWPDYTTAAEALAVCPRTLTYWLNGGRAVRRLPDGRLARERGVVLRLCKRLEVPATHLGVDERRVTFYDRGVR